jgi:serine/threonine protein phosphatase PrpC
MFVLQTSLIGKRESNEDQHDIILNANEKISFFSIYDGHGGNKVSKFLKNNMARYFTNEEVIFPLSETYINAVFSHLQKKLESDHKETAYNSGSTCIILIIYKNENGKRIMYTLNLGDSRAVLCSNNFAIPLTKDHKPDWPEERRRITQLGGASRITFDDFDYRINDLSVSRAFGDIESAPYVTHVPDIYKYKISNNDKFVVLACDGLWDVLNNETVVNFILSNIKHDKNNLKTNIKFEDNRKNIAKNLAELAIQKGSTDNITIIIVFL